ncbi:MAG: glycosyltransferase [Patescibacteria group bacterium]
MISIIIPTLNEIFVIERTLQGLLRSSKYRFEIIVTDGGSTDGTIEIAKKYADKVVIHNGLKRQTIGEGRNVGAFEAKGKYLIFLDADITIIDIDTFFDTVLKFISAKPEVTAFTGHLRVLAKHETFSDRIFFSLVNFIHLVQNNFLKNGAASGEFQVIRKDMFEKLGGYRTDLPAGEDQEFFRRISKAGKTHFHRDLSVYHTGRRAHKIGWARLLSLWVVNDFYVRFLGRSASKVWEEIR